MAKAESPLILAVDQGTSATKALLVDQTGAIAAKSTIAIDQTYPREGWAEQNAYQIWDSVLKAVSACVSPDDEARIVAAGLSVQRESTLVWDRRTGEVLGPVLGWQDKRGSTLCDTVRRDGHAEKIRRITGLPLDSMFSASKAAWLLDRYDPERDLARAGRICIGTIDSWLLWSLAGGPRTESHLIEVGSASRTMLLNLDTCTWDDWLLDRFDIPTAALPTIVSSNGPFPSTRALFAGGRDVPVCAVMGDSHAALFAHAGWQAGRVKATYGTGSSVMGLAAAPATDSPRLARTIAWQTDRTHYALEGNIRSTGATLAWLASTFETTPDALSERAAESSGGVTIVPAFTGLGAPWWDDSATGMISGLSFGSRLPELARAVLESIVFQVEDVVAEIERSVGTVEVLLADGGATRNPRLMQLQADISGRSVHRATASDLSGLGAAHLAGHTIGVWNEIELESLPRARDVYDSRVPPPQRRKALAHWHAEVGRSRMSVTHPAPAT